MRISATTAALCADRLRAREREIRASMVGRDMYEQVLTDLDVERDKFRQLKDDKEQLEHQCAQLRVFSESLSPSLHSAQESDDLITTAWRS